jgi:hypothetical protein
MVEIRALRPHEKLEAWQQAMRLVKAIYGLTQSFPKEETFVTTRELRRAAVSIPPNLAEGSARQGVKELHISFQLPVDRYQKSKHSSKSPRFGYCAESESLNDKLDQLGRLLTGLHKQWTHA